MVSMWQADKIAYRNQDNFTRAYVGSELVWEKSENNKIYYTSSDGQVVTPYSYSSGFGANIVSNTYSGGQGVIEFDGPVTTFPDNGFLGSTLTSIKVPASVTSVEAMVFFRCKYLAHITVDSGNQYYDSRNGCDAIIETATNKLIAGSSNTVIPSSVVEIGAHSFDGNSSLTTILIPNTVNIIGNEAFAYTGLTSINIPQNVNYIYGNIVKGCNNLASITVDQSNLNYGSLGGNVIIEYRYGMISLISGCMNSVIPSITTYIASAAFVDLDGLTSIHIPENVTYIGDWAISRCKNLAHITVDSGNTVYDSRNGCDAIIETATNKLITGCLNTVIPNTVVEIGYGSFENSDLTTANMLNVTSIDTNAFDGCSLLTSVSMPSVVTIGNSSFAECISLTSVTIPSVTTSIGLGCFGGCSNLSEVIVNAVNPPSLDSNCFWGVDFPNLQIKVPAGSVSDYQAAPGWSDYASYIVSQ